jgi:Tfp pilus assembly major pilin PilA
MPRATLPTCVKNLRTIEVFLTKTTEEILWAHFQKLLENWEERADAYSAQLDALSQKYYDTNPYENYTINDWRNNRPKLKYKNAKYSWIEDDDDYTNLNDIKHDVMRCVRAFPEWEQKLGSVYHAIEIFKLDVEELVRFESKRYEESREKYVKEDWEYIKRQNLQTDHRYFHKTKEQFYSDETVRNVVYQNKEPDYWTTCEWCILNEQRLKEQKEYEEEQKRLAEEDERRYKEMCKLKQYEETEARERLTCDYCKYSTYNGDAYERHLGEKQHKANENHSKWFCKLCDHHSRSNTEYEFHIATLKHKKNVGEIEKVTEYTCECCDYTTKRKDLYKKHLTSKTHMLKEKGGGENVCL